MGLSSELHLKLLRGLRMNPGSWAARALGRHRPPGQGFRVSGPRTARDKGSTVHTWKAIPENARQREMRKKTHETEVYTTVVGSQRPWGTLGDCVA